jgi:hypothetical protein
MLPAPTVASDIFEGACFAAATTSVRVLNGRDIGAESTYGAVPISKTGS